MTLGEPPAAASTPDPAAGRLDRTRATIAVGPLLAPVLARLVGMHAARAGLTVDRLDDAVLITDALADCAADALGASHLELSIQSAPGRIELRVGPLRPGAAQRLVDGTALPDTGPLMGLLADEVRVRVGAGGDEILLLRVDAQPSGPELASAG
ncbi:hypothetical protein DSM112329_01657 [Paraconexibacter sp. AEG42_29]|uniref:Histidine kinase/HSP90-like ATPase domain-containing protein n=1 Tax=Paraconexibacter sp. AEG42_29 TaxID=2997339 RepID=A0AAU7AT73_9ACTN